MSIVSIPSLNTLFTKVATTVTPKLPSYLTNREQDENLIENNSKISLVVTAKDIIFQPITRYQNHTLHYVLKSLGYMPTPLLECFNNCLNAPTAEQYPYADAHLRLIIGINNKIKRPLQVSQLGQLRKKFADDGVAMQSPKVWQQPATINSYDRFTNKNKDKTVSWQDQAIANADGGEMQVRCYQPTTGHNPDKVVMLFFHGGGFCIGDTNTHHEFCHAVSLKTGWPVVSVDYRLAPEHPAPAAIMDCIAAYVWLAENAHTLDASSSRIVLAGDSAGGCLAALVAQQVTVSIAASDMDFVTRQQYLETLDDFTADIFQQVKDLPGPFAQWPLYPVTDIETNYPSWALYGEGLLLDHDDVAVFDAACLQDSPLSREHILVSPMLGDNTLLCPSYIIAAELDVLRDEAITYAEQLQRYGINAKIHTVLGAPHGFIHLMSVHQGIGRETNYIISEFASFVHQLILANTDTNISEQKLLAG